jgi:pilus assembly protein CpaB
VGVAGFVHPEDRVDVIVTIRPNDGEPMAKVILQNVKVLAVGKELDVSDHSRNKAVHATVVTVLVNPAESEKLAFAANTARLTLTLRSWTDDKSVETPGASTLSMVTGAEIVRRPPPVAPPPVAETASGRRGKRDRNPPPAAPSVAATPQKEVVEILRGDRLEERKFDKEKP